MKLNEPEGQNIGRMFLLLKKESFEGSVASAEGVLIDAPAVPSRGVVASKSVARKHHWLT